MSTVCEVCGASDPRWLRWIDQGIGDYFQRTMTGFPGATARPAHFCDSAECRAEIEARYGPEGNRAALNNVIDGLGGRGLDADDNEVRLAALAAEITEARRRA
jgi:hypothetical protein